MSSNDNNDEEYWIEQLNRGNKLALSHFFDLHFKSLCYFASRLVQDDDEAKDIVSESFLKLWKKNTDFITAGNIKAFLYISCRNACFQYLRNTKRTAAAQQRYFDQLPINERTVLEEIVRSELLQILNGEIELLPTRCREVFKLIYFDSKKTEEIADELNLSVQTVRNHKIRAIGLLKTLLLKKGITAQL